MKKIRWGIIGCGSIANKFMSSVAEVEDGEVTACASRTSGKAEKFAKKHNIPSSFNSYEDMLKSADIEAVYIATTHNFHYQNVMLSLEHGKSILCEKPMAINADQTRKMVNKARQKELFLMEGMWTRFLPAIRKMKSWLKEKQIGDVKMLRATFAIGAAFNPEHRLFNPELAGGALLDAGIYPISLASFVMDEQPEKVKALADIGETGVDEQSIYAFLYPHGRMAMLSSAVSSGSENRAEIVGTGGRIIIPSHFLGTQDVELHKNNGEKIALRLPFKEPAAFSFEINAAHEAIHTGQNECSIMPLDETLAIAQTMDRLQTEFR